MRVFVAFAVAAMLLSSQQPSPPMTLDQARALAVKVNDAQGQFVDLHEEFFSILQNTTRLVNFPLFVQRLEKLAKNLRAFDADIKRAEATKDTKISRLGKVLRLHVTRVRTATEKLQAIAQQLSKKARDPNYYAAEQYERDVNDYEAARAQIGQTGKELNAAFQSLGN